MQKRYIGNTQARQLMKKSTEVSSQKKPVRVTVPATYQKTYDKEVEQTYFDLVESKKTELTLSRKSIADKGAKVVALGLNLATKIQVLDLSGCDIGPEGATVLGRALISQKTLKKLDLGYAVQPGGDTDGSCYYYFNHLGDEGAKGISVGLTKSTCLEDLRLSYNGISDAGIYALAKASVSNKSLKELNLTWNMDISDKSGKKYGFRKEIKVYWPEK
eukprot:TRINITY_DN715_c0_g1_i1.p1 TRINITY_DN715_c0_g1~~TRINITY_DN715_c0_g1_i1.p1  ORF type:complete len:254 (-),score=19.70 TRINITY_DN715_c0_g1_i1:82-732(-)